MPITASIPLPVGARVDRAQRETGEGDFVAAHPAPGAARHLLPDGEKNRGSQSAGRLAHSSKLANPTNGSPACSLSPEAQVLTVDIPSVHPSGMSCLANRVAWAFSSGKNSPLSPA